MRQTVVLDSGVISLLTHPQRSPESVACNEWAEALLAAGDSVVVPEIADYEVRREYLRRGSTRGLQHLDALQQQFRYIPLNTTAIRKAAELWAWARNHGHITAPGFDVNADIILAAQALESAAPNTALVIATTNV